MSGKYDGISREELVQKIERLKTLYDDTSKIAHAALDKLKVSNAKLKDIEAVVREMKEADWSEPYHNALAKLCKLTGVSE